MKWLFWIAAAVVATLTWGIRCGCGCAVGGLPGRCCGWTVEPTVSAAMVVKNEESVIARKLDNLFALDYPAEKLEIVVVSDGSEDGTVGILEEFGAAPRARAFF